MKLDKNEMLFMSKMVEVVNTDFNASCEDEEGRGFMAQVYEAYKAAGSPKDAKAWLRTFLRDSFKYVDKPPEWVEDEPSWPYFDDKPMVFISQTPLHRTPVTETLLTWDQVLYLFGQRVPHESRGVKGYRMEYRVVVQHVGLDGQGSR